MRLLLVCALLVALGASSAQSPLQLPSRLAGHEVQTMQVQELTRGTITLHLKGQPPSAQQAIDLPLHWDITFPRDTGWAFVRLPFELAGDKRNQPHALLIERLGTAYQIFLNEELIGEGGQIGMPNEAWGAKRPLHLQIPSVLMRQHNELRIVLRADPGRRAGLSPVLLGPAASLANQWRLQELQRVTLPQAASVLSFVAALLCFLLWYQQRDRLYAFAALGELAWGLRITDTWWEAALLPWPNWALVVIGLFWLWSLAIYQMTLALWGGRPLWEKRLVYGLMALGPVLVTVSYLERTATWVVLWTVLQMLVWLPLGLHLAWSVWRKPDWARGLMALSVLVCNISIVRDGWASSHQVGLYAEVGWTKLVAACLAVSICVIVSLRFKRAKDDLLALQQSLEQKLCAREQELTLQHDAVRTLERAAASAQERARILRDMHDGAGAHLITAIRQLEGGIADRAQVIETLRESLDQLRLSIDVMNLPVGDVNSLLASLRFRLQPRIESSGLALVWLVQALPHWPIADEEGMRHLQFIVFEALSNVLQHSRATQITLSANEDCEGIHICIADNGRGYDGTCGNGLRTMQERAHLIGARVTVQPEPAGTTVQIVLPIQIEIMNKSQNSPYE